MQAQAKPLLAVDVDRHMCFPRHVRNGEWHVPDPRVVVAANHVPSLWSLDCCFVNLHQLTCSDVYAGSLQWCLQVCYGVCRVCSAVGSSNQFAEALRQLASWNMACRMNSSTVNPLSSLGAIRHGFHSLNANLSSTGTCNLAWTHGVASPASTRSLKSAGWPGLLVR